MKSLQDWDRKIAEVMDAVRSLREDVMDAVRKSDDRQDTQHRELVDMIRVLQGSRSHSRMDDPPSDARPFDDHHGDFSPTDRTGTDSDRTDPGSRRGQPPTMDTVSDQQGHAATEREEVPGGTQIAALELVPPPVLHDRTASTEIAALEQVPLPILPDRAASIEIAQVQQVPPPISPDRAATTEIALVQQVPPPILPEIAATTETSRGQSRSSSSYRTPPPVDASTDRPLKRSRRHSPISFSETQRHDRLGSDPRGQSSSSLRTPPRTALDQSPPPLRRQDRIRKPGWQLSTPYTNPCLPKRAKIRPPPPHEWMPHGLVDPDHLMAYKAYKRNQTGEL